MSFIPLINVVPGAIGRSALKQAVIAGGSAGNLTVTGIKTRDKLVSVLRADITTGNVTDVTNITSEFSITAADTINNTGGTDTTGDKLIVSYLSAA